MLLRLFPSTVSYFILKEKSKGCYKVVRYVMLIKHFASALNYLRMAGRHIYCIVQDWLHGFVEFEWFKGLQYSVE